MALDKSYLTYSGSWIYYCFQSQKKSIECESTSPFDGCPTYPSMIHFEFDFRQYKLKWNDFAHILLKQLLKSLESRPPYDFTIVSQIRSCSWVINRGTIFGKFQFSSLHWIQSCLLSEDLIKNFDIGEDSSPVKWMFYTIEHRPIENWTQWKVITQ